MPSNSLQCAKELLNNVLTLLGDNKNLTEEQRTSIVAECRRCREELVQVESAEFSRNRYAKWLVGESSACQTILHKARILHNRVEYVIFTNRSEVVLRGPVNTVVSAQPCDKKKNEDITAPNQPCQDPNYRSSSSPSNSVSGHANSAFDHGEDGVRLPMLSESDSGSMHYLMDTKFTNPTLKKHFTEKQENFLSNDDSSVLPGRPEVVQSQTTPVVTRHNQPAATQWARGDSTLNSQSKRENLGQTLRYGQAHSLEQNSISDVHITHSSAEGFTMNAGGHGHAGPVLNRRTPHSPPYHVRP